MHLGLIDVSNVRYTSSGKRRTNGTSGSGVCLKDNTSYLAIGGCRIGRHVGRGRPRTQEGTLGQPQAYSFVLHLLLADIAGGMTSALIAAVEALSGEPPQSLFHQHGAFARLDLLHSIMQRKLRPIFFRHRHTRPISFMRTSNR
jgi:hypothetical protein